MCAHWRSALSIALAYEGSLTAEIGLMRNAARLSNGETKWRGPWWPVRRSAGGVDNNSVQYVSDSDAP
jgi:hypothetical protein